MRVGLSRARLAATTGIRQAPTRSVSAMLDRGVGVLHVLAESGYRDYLPAGGRRACSGSSDSIFPCITSMDSLKTRNEITGGVDDRNGGGSTIKMFESKMRTRSSNSVDYILELPGSRAQLHLQAQRRTYFTFPARVRVPTDLMPFCRLARRIRSHRAHSHSWELLRPKRCRKCPSGLELPTPT